MTPPWRRPLPPAPLETSQPGTSPSRTLISTMTTWREKGSLCSASTWSATTGRQVRLNGTRPPVPPLNSSLFQIWSHRDKGQWWANIFDPCQSLQVDAGVVEGLNLQEVILTQGSRGTDGHRDRRVIFATGAQWGLRHVPCVEQWRLSWVP